MDPRLHRSATPAISSAQPLPPTPGGGLHGMPAHPHLGHHHWPPVSTGLSPSLNPPPPSPVGYPHLSPGMGDPRSVIGPGSHGPGGNPFYHPQFSLLDAHHHHQRMAAESHRINMAHAEVARMAEVQRVLEDSRKKEAAARAAAAAANVTTSSFQFTGSSLSSLVASSSATREPLFSHGLSPLDRGGLYPSHGGILDPLSTSIPHPSPRGGMSLTSPSSSMPKPKMFSPYESSPTTSSGPSGPLLKPTPSVPFRPFGPPSHSEPSHCPLSASFMGTNTSVVSTTGTMSSVLSSDATPRPLSSLRENDHKIIKLDKPEEPEEVLVDDFDGQCCRTYPYNHSRIQRWQREHAEKRRHRKDVSAPPSVDRSSAREQKGAENSAATSGTERSQSGSRRSEHLSGAVGSNSASLRSASADGRRDTSLGSNLQHQKSVSEANLPATTGSIPVGIAIGRQRQQESLDFKRAEDLSRAAAAASNSGTSSQCGPHGEKYGTMMNPQGVSPLGAHGPMRWPHPPSGSPMWPPSHVPPGTPSPGGYPSIPPWMPPGLVGAPPQMGPIPMGYQLAKDPLTGQILLIPTDVANNPPQHGAWPTPPSPYEQQPSGMSHFTSLGPPPATPPVSSSAAVAHFHQMYMHQQMYMQQAAAAAHHHAASASKGMYRPPLPSVRRLEPETITVSDDDDEPHQKRTTTSSSADGMRHTREIEDPNAAFDRLFDSTEPRLSTDSKLEEESSETICSKNVDISSELPPKSPPSQEDLIVKDDVVPKSEEEETVIKTEPIEANVTKCPSPPLSPTLNPSTQEDVEEEPPLNQMVPQEPMPEKSSLQEDCEEIARELLFFSENERFHGEDLRATRDDPADLSPLKILLEAIDISEKNKHFEAQPQCIGFSEGITALCQITQTDLLPLGLQSKFLDLNHINIKLLCTVTATDLDELRSRVDPLQTWNEIYNLHQYSCDEAEVSVKDFIANKIKQYPPPNPVTLNLAIDGVSTDIALGVGLELTTPKEDNYMGIKSLAKIVKQIKNTDIMSQLEVELRGQLAEIQTLYREKHREMTRLKLNTPKKGSAKGGGRSKRGPGRPKKRKLTSKGKTKMGRPRKTKLPSTDSRPGGEFEDLSPPILEPCATPPTLESQIKVEPMPRSRSDSPNNKNEGGDQLLKPPKLTASLIPSRANSNSVTNLSTINAKFMKGKANPFANLLSKLATGSTCGGSASSQHSKQNSEDEDENEESGSRRNSTSSSHSLSHKSNYSSHSTRKDSDEEANSSSKKRKADKPRKHTGSTETIVPKKPRNLFMMNCLNLQREFKSTSAAAAHSSSMRDEYDFTDDEEERGGGDHPTHILGSLVASKGEGPSAASGSKPTQMCGGSLLFTEYRSPPHGTSSPPPTTSSASTSSTLFSKGNKPWKDQKKSKSPKNVGSFNNSNLNSPSHKGISSSVLASSPTPSSKSKEKKHKSSAIESPASKAGVISATTSTLSPSGSSAPPPSALPSTSSTTTPTTMAIEGAVAEYALPSSSTGQTALRTATLKASDLKDGLRFLWLDNGRFHPARLNSTPLDDIYSVTMEKQRSNRPDIMPRDDVLNLGIFELRPLSKKQLPIGTRVCVYWSQAYNYLFPGTVDLTEVPFKETMVEVFLDDGDRRQVDIVNVRMLPPNYSHVVPAPDPLDTRKRRQSNDSADANHDLHHPRIQPLYQRKGSLSPSPAKKCKQIAPITTPHGKLNKKRHKHKHCSKKRHKHYHKKSYPPPPTETIYEEKEDERHRGDLSDEDDDCEESPDEESGNLRIKLDGSFNNTTTYSIRSPMYQTRTTSEESNHGDDEIGEDSSDESGSESESGGETDKAASRVSGINPVTGRPFWRWVEGDEGYRRPGKKGGKAKKLFHRAIQRDSEILNVGDCAVFLSTARVDRPYIGRVELLWETWNGNMMVKVKWFYHPEEIETSGKNFDLKVPGGLFQSPHTDENDVQTISHKCQVLPLREYSRVLISDPVKRRKLFSNSDTYYLAGSYDPTNMSVNFQSGVLKNSS
ncbi:hypothetical protein TCAL_03225 [Tigriopus californicus]|uniref:BAH domain-containing protein n=1 Tax=Tigriopus californicus TaxID=6832 RepID=A0A553NT61_TIGCA|nr:hypothetical protein TCAL_03225 [Tigriopus californicus]